MWLQHGCLQADPQPTHALIQHAERILDHLAGITREGIMWQTRARKTKRHSVRKTNHQHLHNSIRRPEPTTGTCAPECTQSSIVPSVQPRTQVISPGPVANRLTQCRPPAEAPPATPAAMYARHTSRSSLQHKNTPAVESSVPWKEFVCAHGNRVRRQKSRPPKRATRHAQAQAQSNMLTTYYRYAGRYP